MTTTPNFRPNLLQLVRINNENNMTFQGDSVNRTINFAARHYMIVALTTLPLQFEQTVPPGYPALLKSFFHWDPDVRDHYSPCTWCCNDVDDVPLEFGLATQVDLTCYSSLRLVGCSPYEEYVLLENMREATEGRARRWAVNQQMDPTNVLVQEIAYLSVLSLFHTEQLWAFEGARDMGFKHTPSGQTLDALAVAMNLKNPGTVSINLLRSIPAEVLYNFLVCCIVEWYISWVGQSSTLAASMTGDMLQDFRNPLGPLFEKLRQAGLLQKVLIGSHNSDVTAIRIEWLAGDGTNGEHAATSFIRQHRSFLENWADGISVAPSLKIFINMETDDVIEQRLENDYQSLTMVAARYLTKSSGGKTCVDDVVDCMMLAWAENPRDSAPGLAESWDEVNLTLLEAHLVNKFRAVNDVTQHRRLARLVVLCHIPMWLRRAEWVLPGQLVVGQLSNMFEVCLFDDFEFRVSNEGTVHNEKVAQALTAMLPEPVLRHVIDCQLRFVEMGIITPDMIDMVDTLVNNCTAIIQPVNCRMYGIITREDAERVVKSQAESVLDRLRDGFIREQELAQELRAHEAVDLDIRHACHMAHPEYNLAPPMFEVGRPPHPELYDLMRDPLKELAADLPTDVHVDLREVTRCVGRHNTSVAKFSLLMADLGIFDILTEVAHPFTVVCLADGIGGVTAMCAHHFPQAQVVYNSLMVGSTDQGEASDASIFNPPLETLDTTYTPDTATRIHWSGSYPGDLTLPEVQYCVMSCTAKLGLPVFMITMDADINWAAGDTGYRPLLWAPLIIASQILHPDGVCIVKTFNVEYECISEFLYVLHCLYMHVHITRSPSTRSGSWELLIAFAVPYNMLTTAGLVINAYQGVGSFMMSVELCGVIRHASHNFADQVHQWRTAGRYIHPIPLMNIFNTYAGMRLWPLSCHHLTQIWGTHEGSGLRHKCTLLYDLKTKVSADVGARVLRLMPRRGRTRIRATGRRGQIVGAGWAFMFSQATYVTSCLTMIWFVESLCEANVPILFMNLRDHIDRLWDVILDRLAMLRINVQWDPVMNSWVITAMTKKLSLLSVVKKAIMRCLQICGVIRLIDHNLLEYQQECLHWIQGFHRDIVLHQCCIDQAAQSRQSWANLDGATQMPDVDFVIDEPDAAWDPDADEDFRGDADWADLMDD
uniref:RNA-directed RNA polymerase L n=1 Tax=Shrew ollusvirus TaxID=3139588 RepID=A0AB38ZJX1_9VIRU